MDFKSALSAKLPVARLTALVALALLIASCDSFLEESPQDRISPSNFYETRSDAIAAVDAAYSQLQEYGSYFALFWYITGSADDLGLKPAEPAQALRDLTIDYSADATNSAIEGFWQSSYEGINRANAVLSNIPSIEIDESLRNRLMGEARFLRALHYFNLVRFFGDVPLIRDETSSLDSLNVGEASTEEVYSLIVSDLEQAMQVLPASYDSENQGRATQGAAQTLLAKVHLTQENWNEAARLAGEVISSGTYALLPEWKEVFRIRSEFSSESIFEVNFDATLGTGSTHTAFALPNGYPGGAAYGVYYALPNLVSEYAPEDERAEGGTYMTSPHTDPLGRTYAWDSPPGPSINKWFDETSSDNLENRGYAQMDNNWYVFRYAEVLLIYAEAVNEGGSATAGSKYEALNAVRTRPGLQPVSGLGTAAFRDSLRVERRREFVYEGKRWFDLKRWGVLVERIRETKNPDLPQERTLFPIPQRELDTNPELSQNPGY